MTMFSIKPKFDLAEFLAVPAPVGAARSRNARRRKMFDKPAETSEETSSPSSPDEPASTEKPE
jgi:hypothetical protein